MFRQDGTQVDDVILPPWARGSPDEFVRLQRYNMFSSVLRTQNYSAQPAQLSEHLKRCLPQQAMRAVV